MNHTSLKLRMTRKALPLVLLCSMSFASAFELGLEKVSCLGGKMDGVAAFVASCVAMCGLKGKVTRDETKGQDFALDCGVATCVNAVDNVAFDSNMNPLNILTAAGLKTLIGAIAEKNGNDVVNKNAELCVLACYLAAKYGIEGVKGLISSN